MESKRQRGRAKLYGWIALALGLCLGGAYWMTRPWLDSGYGIASIDLENGNIYLKRLDSGAVGPERLWVSEDPHRCSGFPDPTRDYLSSSDYGAQMNFKVSYGELFIYDYSDWQSPRERGNVTVHFERLSGYNYKNTTARVYKAGTNPEIIPLSTVVVKDIRPCSRFPDGLIDGSWRDWFDPQTFRFVHVNGFSRR